MSNFQPIMLSGLGIIAGCLIAIQTVLNSSLGQRVGNLGSVFVITLTSVLIVLGLMVIFPSTTDFHALPGKDGWYLYIGGALGVIVLVSSVFLVPRIGTSATLILIVLGQAITALVIDHYGLLASPKIEVTLARGIGVLLVAAGAFLVVR